MLERKLKSSKQACALKHYFEIALRTLPEYEKPAVPKPKLEKPRSNHTM